MRAVIFVALLGALSLLVGGSVAAGVVVLYAGPDAVGSYVNGKITFVHRRLWPALVRVAKRFPATRKTTAPLPPTPTEPLTQS